MSFKKINIGNDWMSLYYSFGPVLTKQGTCTSSLGTVTFKEGDEWRVRWPDGSESVEHVILRRECGTYGDMGHEYPYENQIPYVKVENRGTATFVKLTDLELWVDE